MKERRRRENKHLMTEPKTYDEIWEKIDRINIHDKIDQVNIKIGQVQSRKAEETKRLKATTTGISLLDKPLGVLHRALQMLSVSNTTTGRSVEEIMQETARMLKKHMENVVPEPPILLDETQYQDILRKVFLDSKSPQAQETSNNTAATATTLGEDHIMEILNNHKVTLDNHKIALEIIGGLLPRPQLPEGHSVSVEQAKGLLQAYRVVTITIVLSMLLPSKKPWRRSRRYHG